MFTKTQDRRVWELLQGVANVLTTFAENRYVTDVEVVAIEQLVDALEVVIAKMQSEEWNEV